MGKINKTLKSLSFYAVVLIDPKSGKHICNAAYVKAQQVVAPLHCFATLEARDFRIQTPKDGKVWEIEQIRTIVEHEGYFPSFDIAVLTMKKTWPAFHSTLINSSELPQNGKYVLETVRPGQEEILSIPMKKLRAVQGPRTTPLEIMEAGGPTIPCYGDSGAPVYRLSKQGKELVGFLTGLSYPLTPSSFNCEDRRRLITPIKPYRTWLEGKKVSFSRMDRRSPTISLESTCQEQDFFSPSWVAIQDLIMAMLPPEKQVQDHDSFARLLLECKGLDKLWEKTRGLTFKFNQILSVQEFPFLAQIQKAKFDTIRQSDLTNLSGWTGLKQLTLNGSQDAIDFSSLNLSASIKSISILHSQNFIGLSQALQRLKSLETLHLYNAIPQNPSELDSIRQAMPQLKITMDQLQRPL